MHQVGACGHFRVHHGSVFSFSPFGAFWFFAFAFATGFGFAIATIWAMQSVIVVAAVAHGGCVEFLRLGCHTSQLCQHTTF
jgi:hypothetical protein